MGKKAQKAAITRVDLGVTPQVYPLISHIALEYITACMEQEKPVIVYFNRGGGYTVSQCIQCNKVQQCESCGRLYRSMLKDENKVLYCPQCRTYHEHQCQTCQSPELQSFGDRIQSVGSSLERHFGGENVHYIDHKNGVSFEKGNVYLCTQSATTVYDTKEQSIGIVWILFESDLSAPTYDIENSVYTHAAHHLTAANDGIVQTYLPDHPLVKDFCGGNFRDFFERTLADRKIYHLPPYATMCDIIVRAPNKKLLERHYGQIFFTLASTFPTGVIQSGEVPHIAHIQEEYVAKIRLEGNHVEENIQNVSHIIAKNRYTEIHWL